MDEQRKPKKVWTVVEQPAADVHTTTSMPNALKLYAKQVVVARPASLNQVVSSHLVRIQHFQDKDQVILEWLAKGFMVPSVALAATLIFLAWMVSGPVKAGILAAVLFLMWVIFG